MQHAQSSWFFWLVSTSCLLLEVAAGNGTVVGHGAVHLPITYGRPQSQHSRRTVDGQVAVGGLGDYEDMCVVHFVTSSYYSRCIHRAYSVLVKLGTTSVPLLLDSGSADLWAISDSCPKNCSHGLPTFPHKKLNYSGVDARLFYGDSFSTCRPVRHFAHLLNASFFHFKTDNTLLGRLVAQRFNSPT